MKPSAAWLSLCLPALVQAAPLSEDAATKLSAHGMVVIDEPILQGFSACIGPEHPVFVTSDSLPMEAENAPRPGWMDPITGAAAPRKGK